MATDMATEHQRRPGAPVGRAGEPAANTASAQDELLGGSDAADDLEGWLRRELRDYALALRQMAYSLPNGIGERDLLRLSEQLTDLADGGLAERFAAFQRWDASTDELREADQIF